MKALHFVKEKNLNSIKKTGYLKPKTPFFQDKKDEKNYGKPKKDFKDKIRLKYICVIPKSKINSWITSGLIKEIKFFVKPDYVLEFNIPKDSFKFIREHNYTSPVETKKRFKLNQFKDVSEPCKTKIWNKYLGSNKIFKNRNSLKNIKVPELWINAKIPFNKIEIIKFSSFKKKYKIKNG